MTYISLYNFYDYFQTIHKIILKIKNSFNVRVTN